MEETKIIVSVRGGVAYCDDPRVEIIDYDNLEDAETGDFHCTACAHIIFAFIALAILYGEFTQPPGERP